MGDQRLNHWKKGVPQNPDSWAYKVYHFHLNNPPCSMNALCRGIGANIDRSHKVHRIIQQLRKVGTWTWPKRPDRNQTSKNRLREIADRHGEFV